MSEVEPRTFPVCERLSALSLQVCPATTALFDAVLNAAPHVCWRQSYTTDDPGIDQHYLDNYGWFNLIAPTGPFLCDDFRLSIGYWGQGLHYPSHRHEPEEIYLTIAGSATYISEGRSPVEGGPGTTICHYSNQMHSASMENGPLLAAAFWRGANLERKSDFRADQ